ncbi:MAG: hypothetical protein HYY60_00430 [Parcubacteria group bacterium]|nr:hypothetical protein [Parcubacteria group bacterium]MBI3074881.1 hypothetical protein [Parcubacteria group bacterium]
MDALEKIFNSPAQVKIMRLFLYSADTAFDFETIKNKTQLSSRLAGKIVHRLLAADFIRQRTVLKPPLNARRGRSQKRLKGWILNQHFLYLEQFRNLLMSCQESERTAIAKRFARAGHVKLLAISGIFLQSESSRVDILLVGDHLRHAVITQALKAIEANMGKDLRYAVLETKDFLYRLSVYDKFVRDILDYPHEKLVDRFGLR